MLCRPFRAKVTTTSLQGFHPCLWSERPFGALRQGISNFRNMSFTTENAEATETFKMPLPASMSEMKDSVNSVPSVVKKTNMEFHHNN